MTFIQPDVSTAAEAARKEAEAAHVTPGAVFYSAPEGYATGAGESFAPAEVVDDHSVIAPVTDTLVTGEVEAFEARTFGDGYGQTEDSVPKAADEDEGENEGALSTPRSTSMSGKSTTKKSY